MTATSTGASASTINIPNGPASPLAGDAPLPFPQLCAKIHDRITAFLDEKEVSPRVKGVQEQTRIALGVIEKVLDQYRYVTDRATTAGSRMETHGM